MDTVSCSATTGVSSRCKWAESVQNTLPAFCLLWFAEFRHWPLVGTAFTLICFLGGLSLGIISRCMTDPNNLNAANLNRIPFLMNCCIAGVTYLASFQVRLIYASLNRPLLFHFAPQKSVSLAAYLGVAVLRSMFFGTLGAALWMGTAVSFLQLPVENFDVVICIVACFVAACSFLCYCITLLISPTLAAHVILLLDCFATYCAGPVFSLEPD